MSKNATESQRQSEAIRGNQLLVIQRSSESIRCNQAAPQTQSGAIRRIQTHSDAIRRNQHVRSFVFPCFRVLGGPQGPVFCVFVFWAGTTGLCFVFSCFGRPPSKHSTGPKLSSFVELSRAILSSTSCCRVACRVPVEFPVELSRPGLNFGFSRRHTTGMRKRVFAIRELVTPFSGAELPFP
jgi:hypothetical protein